MKHKNTVRIVEFKLKDIEKSQVESELEDLLDEGFRIASQHESDGYIYFTLVRNTVDLHTWNPNVLPAVPQSKHVH